MLVRDGSAVFTVQLLLNCHTHGSTLISNKNVTIKHISDFLSRYSSPGKRILAKPRKERQFPSGALVTTDWFELC